MIRKGALLPIFLFATPPTAVAAPPSDADAPPKLLKLRKKLANKERAAALKTPSRFRALCDADGYPLVGNLVRKGDVYQVSQFCEDVREDQTKA